MLHVIEAFFGFDKHIVDVDFHGLAHQWSKYLGHQPLIDRSGCNTPFFSNNLIVALIPK